MRRRTAELLKALDLDAKPDTRVDTLAPGERQLVEIAKALHRDARLIIFDEPTTSLTKRETDRLFRTIERLRAQGKTMIYISHVLGDVMRLANSVAVLRDGALVTQGPIAEFNIPTMIRHMIGRDLKQLFPERTGKPLDEPVLEVAGLSQPGIVKDVTFTVGAARSSACSADGLRPQRAGPHPVRARSLRDRLHPHQRPQPVGTQRCAKHPQAAWRSSPRTGARKG
jgi:ribose transport system ATP-binding protein